jgi:hypothetical protein
MARLWKRAQGANIRRQQPLLPSSFNNNPYSQGAKEYFGEMVYSIMVF